MDYPTSGSKVYLNYSVWFMKNVSFIVTEKNKITKLSEVRRNQTRDYVIFLKNAVNFLIA